MVYGIEIFIEYFKEYKDQYVLIGGTAYDIIMQEYDIEFRTTKDLDIVLIIEALNNSFCNKFWDFIREGEYKNITQTSKKPQFYRFTEPNNSKFPKMIELFSIKQFDLQLRDNTGKKPIHVDDNIKSLSAILLNEDYYKLLLKGKKEDDNLSYLSDKMLILFKIKAYLDLKDKKRKGIHIDKHDITKHKNDIFKLISITNPQEKIILEENIKLDLIQFILIIRKDKPDLKALNLGDIPFNQFIETLNEIYLY